MIPVTFECTARRASLVIRLLLIHSFAHAISCHLKGRTLVSRGHSRLINIKDTCSSSPFLAPLPIRRFLREGRVSNFGIGAIKGCVVRQKASEFAVRTSFNTAARAIMRSFHCCANCPETQGFCTKRESSPWLSHLCKSSGLGPKTG